MNYNNSIKEIKLIVFILDISETMGKTLRGISRKEFQNKLIKQLLSLYKNHRLKSWYRFSIIYFSNKAYTDPLLYNIIDNIKLEAFHENSTPSRKKSISESLNVAKMIITNFLEKTTLPPSKNVDIILITDGEENIDQPKDIKNIASEILNMKKIRTRLITILLSNDLNKSNLIDMSSELKHYQVARLMKKNLAQLLPNPNKIFLNMQDNPPINRIVKLIWNIDEFRLNIEKYALI